MMKFKEWIKTIPKEISEDPLWKMKVYKYALYISDIACHDVSHLSKNKMMLSVCDQLYRSTGSVSANLEEGYSRKSKLDRARFLNIPWDQQEKAGDGIIKPDIRSRMKFINQGLYFLQKL